MWVQMEGSCVSISPGKVYFLMCQIQERHFPTVDSMVNNTEQSGYWKVRTCDQTPVAASDITTPLPAILDL
jgi:hypothetical protein